MPEMIRKHLREIEETKRQINATNSEYRKKDLKKHLAMLRRELREYNILTGSNYKEVA